MPLYLKDADFIDWRTLKVRRTHIEVSPGPGGGLRFPASIPKGSRVLDCRGRIVTKSFVVGHHHIYSALARGMPAPRKAPRDFAEILKYVWWNLDKKLDLAMVRASALACGVEAARCGTTFLIDHHASPNAAPGSLHAIAEALEEVGLSHLLCYELSARDGRRRWREGLAETEAYLRSRPGLVGLHASFTVTDEVLSAARRSAERHGTGFHVHVAEDPCDQQDCLRRYGKRVVRRFHEAGLLESPKTILAHCLHLDAAERRLLAKSRAWVAQNAESNQNNDVGVFDPRGLGERILIGTDGMHSDAPASARAAYLAAGPVGGLSPLSAYRRLRAAHGYLSSNGFSGDGENNLVVLDYPSPTPVTPGNWAGHMIYGYSRAHVESVISRGRLIVERRRVVAADEERVLARAKEEAKRLWRRL